MHTYVGHHNDINLGLLIRLTSGYNFPLTNSISNLLTALGFTKVLIGFACGFNPSCWPLATKSCSYNQDPNNNRCNTLCNL